MERFIVKSITGFTNNPRSSGEGRKPTTTYWVADTAYCYQEMMLLSPNRVSPLKSSTGTVIQKGKPLGIRITFIKSVADFTAKILNERYT